MTIVFIDDDPDDTAFFCEVIAYLHDLDPLHQGEPPIHCIQLNDSRKAIDVLSEIEVLPDYIFLDINMPVVSGKECLSHLKSLSRFAHIPVIMFSTTVWETDACELMKMGAVDCVVKPASFVDLAYLFSKYLYNKRDPQ
jgi:CheY-like chemotaxis protein